MATYLGKLQKVIESLKSRFGREDLQVEVYVRELLALSIQNATNTKKLPLSQLYDKLESHVRALETLGVTSEKCAVMLYPLVESSLPEETLRAWNRVGSSLERPAQNSVPGEEGNNESKDRLKRLLKFLEREVNNEERIQMAMSGFKFNLESEKGKTENKEKIRKSRLKNSKSTAIDLLNKGGSS